MEKLTLYKQILRKWMSAQLTDNQTLQEEETYMVVDEENQHYLLYHNGWDNMSRSYGCFFHARIKNEKIFIEYNGTDIEVAEDLVVEGVAKADIVLAFHAPAKRKHTGFGVA